MKIREMVQEMSRISDALNISMKEAYGILEGMAESVKKQREVV